MEKQVDVLKGLTEELLSLMSINATVEVSVGEESETFVVNINSEEATGLLIGKKGDTLSSIQTILSVLLKTKTGEWYRVLVNVGDYREKEEAYLKDLAETTAQRAKETGEPQHLYNLKSWQRRLVHMALSEDGELVTESQGEGEERYLVVKKKNS